MTTATTKDVQQSISDQNARIRDLQAEVDNLSQQIADAIISRKSTTTLEKQHESKQAELERAKMVLPRLEEAYLVTQKNEALAYYRTAVENREKAKQSRDQLRQKFIPLEQEFKAAENAMQEAEDAYFRSQRHVGDIQQDYQQRHKITLDEFRAINEEISNAQNVES